MGLRPLPHLWSHHNSVGSIFTGLLSGSYNIAARRAMGIPTPVPSLESRCWHFTSDLIWSVTLVGIVVVSRDL